MVPASNSPFPPLSWEVVSFLSQAGPPPRWMEALSPTGYLVVFFLPRRRLIESFPVVFLRVLFFYDRVFCFLDQTERGGPFKVRSFFFEAATCAVDPFVIACVVLCPPFFPHLSFFTGGGARIRLGLAFLARVLFLSHGCEISNFTLCP